MGSLLFAGASLWKYMFADFNHADMRNTIIALHVIGWVFQFIGHGVFESNWISRYREKASAFRQFKSNIFSPSFCFYRIV